MSAPAEGRNSPPPSEQSDKQQSGITGSGTTSSDAGTQNKEASENTKLHDLQSNPKGPLEDAADEKLSKTEK
ncbi:MAG: hypothetical protein M1823_000219 [Watsoniomyces obsoletus]|nr:MAG: hypothetical protein M1823_000219 [Watsoniomyces obsoletus]